MAQATHLYFDHPYEPDPEERGYYWATRFTDTPKVFGFMPDNLYANIKVKRTGAPLTREEFCRTQDVCPDLMHKGNVVGMAAFLKKFSLPMGLYHDIFRLLNVTEIKGILISGKPFMYHGILYRDSFIFQSKSVVHKTSYMNFIHFQI